MTEVLFNPKIKAEHLAHKDIVDLRQSSEKQVRRNKESQHLRYAVQVGRTSCPPARDIAHRMQSNAGRKLQRLGVRIENIAGAQ